MMTESDPDWTAPRIGNDWRDETVLKATNWLRSFVKSKQMSKRLDATRSWLLAAHGEWASGRIAEAFDRTDTAAWNVFQAETYAIDRQFWVPDYTNLIVPIMTRIGEDLDLLRSIPGVEERAERIMNSERAQPAGGLFEFLVALSYRREGWSDVRFLKETPGIGRTPDLDVSRPRKHWAVECKTVSVSEYEAQERKQGDALARPAHQAALSANRSIVMQVIFKRELDEVPEDYLVQRVHAFMNDVTQSHWEDELSIGRIRDIDWRLFRKVIAKDYVYFGGSRMIELLVGEYHHQFEHSLAAKWRPAETRPFYADAVYQASVVSWANNSSGATRRKARHFRSILGKANGQLPIDRPGAVHIGIESRAGMRVDAMRHMRNTLEARDFDPRPSRLRWAYVNFLVPEMTTRRDESWALIETMIPYRIGRHRTAEPLPGHLLLPGDDRRPGVHWDGRG